MTTTISSYEQQAIDFLAATKTTAAFKQVKYDFHFEGDTEKRYIWDITLKNTNGRRTFRFGQSVANGGDLPSAYDLLAAITKNDPGTFENFCSEYGYETDSRKAEKTYRAVVREWAKVSTLFSEDQIEALQEIA